MRNHLILAVLATGLLSACGTTSGINNAQITAPIPKDRARVVVERNTSLLYLAAPATVEANGVKIASLGRGGSAVHDVRSGQNTLSVSTPTAFGKFIVRFDAKPQQVYRFRVSPKSDALLLGSAFGMIGDAVNAQISDTSGYFQLEMVQ